MTIANSFKFAEIAINDKVFMGVANLSFSDNVEQGDAPSTLPIKLKSTTGNYAAECSFTMVQEDAMTFLASLTEGVYLHEFDINAVYTHPKLAEVKIQLVTCRLTSISDNQSDGADALQTEFSARVTYIDRNGNKPFGNEISL